MPAFGADFTAIDFETANHRRDSACQLAAVRVRNGEIVDSAMWMIRPKPFFFTRANVRIHGITADQVAEESEFGELWQDIADTFGDDCLVAHNARFDIGVLLECLRRHRKEIPTIQFTCTRAIARAAWPGRRRYGLKALADWLGVRFKHHDALEDSIACAKVLLAAGIDKEASSLPTLEQTLKLDRGSAGSWGFRGPGRTTRGQSRRRPGQSRGRENRQYEKQLSLPLPQANVVAQSAANYAPIEEPEASQSPQIDFQRLLVRADFIRPLSGKCVVFAGKLKRFTGQDAALLASRAGGRCQDDVDRQTTYLVIGNTDGIDQQQETANKLQQDGAPIRILSEEEFLGLVVSQS